MDVFANEVNNLKELEFHRVINEQGKKIVELDERVAFLKLKHDEHLGHIDRLEEELSGRDNAVYEMNKRLLAFDAEKKLYDHQRESDDFEVIVLREKVCSLESELNKMDMKLKSNDIYIINLETELKFRDAKVA